MDITTLAQQIKAFLGKGYTGEALQTMEAQLQSWRRFHDQIIMLQAQYYECQQDERAGTIDSGEAQLRQNRINSGILGLLAELEDAGGLFQPAAANNKSEAQPQPQAAPGPASKPAPPATLNGEIEIPFEPKQMYFNNNPEFVTQIKRVFVSQSGEEMALTFDLKFINKSTDNHLILGYFQDPKWRLFDDQGEFIVPAENNVPYSLSTLETTTASLVFRFPRSVRIQSLGLFYSDNKFEDVRYPMDWSGVP